MLKQKINLNSITVSQASKPTSATTRITPNKLKQYLRIIQKLKKTNQKNLKIMSKNKKIQNLKQQNKNSKIKKFKKII